MIVDEMIISSSSSSSSVSLNCLTANEALRRPDVSVVEWYVVNRRYILSNFGDTAKAEVMCSDLREELNDAIALLISEESV
jgi:hypothetical protein